MALKQHIQTELIDAMKSKNEVKVGVLRMLKAAIMKFEMAGERKDANDDDVMKLIQKEIKSRRDSVEQFIKGNRPQMAEAEEKEIAVLMEYMPPQMTKEEIETLVKEAINEVGAKGKGDIGRVMGALMPRVQGKADGKVVGEIVNALLA